MGVGKPAVGVGVDPPDGSVGVGVDAGVGSVEEPNVTARAKDGVTINASANKIIKSLRDIWWIFIFSHALGADYIYANK